MVNKTGAIPVAKPRRRRRWLTGWLLPAGPPPRRRWWVPAEGRCWLLITVLFLAMGLMKHINLVLLLGYLLLVTVVLNAVLAGRRLRRLRTRRHVAGPVFAGAPCAIEVHLDNPGRRPVVGVEVEDVGPHHSLNGQAVRVEGSGSCLFRDEVVLPRRGRYTWGPVAVASAFPFGLVRARALLGPPGEVLVLPRLGWVHRGRLRRHLRQAGPEGDAIRRRRPQRDPSAQAEFHGLRVWRTGDSPRNIHWRTSARRGELMVREYEDVPSDNLLLVFDPTLPIAPASAKVTQEALFEEAVSLAATVCWEWCRRKGDRLIVAVAGAGWRLAGGSAPNGLTLTPKSANPFPPSHVAAGESVLDGVAGPSLGRQVLERLAVVRPAAGGEAFAGLAAQLAAYADVAASAVVVSVGPSGLAGALTRALRRPVACLDAADLARLDFYQPPGVGL